MLFQKIRIKNIRSYVDEEIKFPEGVTLLSGDIGFGKSTVLLAIDFALFGIRRGELSGSALLRNGTQDGYVILDFSVDNKEISVKRVLKKTGANGIVQDAGYITINDITEQLTPVELKQRIIEILKYPQESLSKKSLIYRYTVYTPQEEMKAILLGEKEDRLQTLRKVFNIDKYKIIKDNSKIVVSEIKQRKKECAGFIHGLEEKKSRFFEQEKYILGLNENIANEKIKLQNLNKIIENKKEEHGLIEWQVQKLQSLKKDLELLNYNYISKEEQKLKNSIQLKLIESQIVESGISYEEIDVEKLRIGIEENDAALQQLESELKEIVRKTTDINSRKQNSESIKLSIEKLDTCPLCEQKVAQDHKHALSKREEEKLQRLSEDLNALIKKENELNIKIKEIKEIIKDHKNKEIEYRLNKVKINEVKLKKELLSNLRNEINEAEKALTDVLNKKKILEKDLDVLKQTEDRHKTIKQELDSLLQKQKMIEISIASTNREIETIGKGLATLKGEITEKELSKKKLDYYIKLQDWLENFLINIVDIMEKKVMMRVHSDFDLLFQKWFGMLMDTDLIKVRLDEEFTPIIDQNSHDMEYENLSGGEKTACALAYRLALNQVINYLVSSINTKDIIILDEPTDGFSAEQLDKIRYVLQELKMRQIIIVSHESKVEAFADNIIRIKKEGHVSKIII